MNILLSYDWLKEYVKTKKSPKELASLLSLHSMSVEKVMPEVELLTDKIVLGEILEVNPHPNADKLQLATVSTGKAKHKVVCGAPNIKAGMKIAFAGIGAMVKWHGEGDPVELEEAKIRGEESFGMICDDSEIGLAKEANPQGITDYSHLKAKVGTPMAEALKLDDTVLEIEITTNRIDAASVIGIASETAAITGEELRIKPFEEPGKPQAEKPLKITIKDKEKCQGFNGIVLTDVKVEPSPEWLQRRLRAAGHSVFYNVVDITNYVMREVGHPLHAFDYDKVKDGHLLIRAAERKEKLALLDGSTAQLDENMVVVADKSQALSLGGVIGGESSKVTEQTTTVLLESASWNPQVIRKTMMSLDKFSDAGSYFNKGVSPQMSQVAIKRAIQLFQEICGAKIASSLISEGYKEYKPAEVSMRLSRAEQMIGDRLDVKKVTKQLETLGFKVKASAEKLVCTVPHWRQFDVTIEEDIIEEVARLYGYHNVKNVLPSGQMPIPVFDKQFEAEEKINNLMKGAGFTEVFTYSMVSEKLHKIGGRHQKEALRLLNPLDDDHVVMRTALVPSIIEVAAQNQGLVESMHLFEIANIYEPSGNGGKVGSGKKAKLPEEFLIMAGLVMTGNLSKDFREVKGVVQSVFEILGLEGEVIETLGKDYSVVKNGTNINYSLGKEWAGSMGVIDSKVGKALGLKGEGVIFTLPFGRLAERSKHKLKFIPIPKFPAIELDLSINVNEAVAWGEVQAIVQKAGGDLLRKVELFDIYQKDGVKSFAFHLNYRSDKKTLEMKDVEVVQAGIIKELEKNLKATLKK